MQQRHYNLGLRSFCVALVLSATVPRTQACMALAQSPDGKPFGQLPVISSERAVIIWDQAHKIEHFIRQAEVNTSSPDLGFLVPTPQIPELVEADPRIFEIGSVMAQPRMIPEVVSITPLQALSDLVSEFGSRRQIFSTISAQLSVALSQPPDVQVVSEQNVANYHAAVLAADDAAALAKWLKDNGYALNANDENWLKPYILAKWKITAFKLLKGQGDSANFISTRAIRMSFSTDRPFFPYKEPGGGQNRSSAGTDSRSLEVAILSDVRMSGKLEDGNAWRGVLQYAGTSAPQALPDLPPEWSSDNWLSFAKLDDPKYQLTLPQWLTYFRDESNPRPGTADLYFSASSDPSPMRQVKIDYSLPKSYHLDWSHPFSDLLAVIILITPFAITYFLFRISRSVGTKSQI